MLRQFSIPVLLVTLVSCSSRLSLSTQRFAFDIIHEFFFHVSESLPSLAIPSFKYSLRIKWLTRFDSGPALVSLAVR